MPAASGHGPSHAPTRLNENLSALQILFRVIVPLLILGGGFAVMKAAGIMRPPPEREVKVIGPPRVKTANIETWNESLTLDVDGSVVPFREISVTAEVAGRIIKKSENCRAGKFVKKGTPLFEINPVDFDLRKQQLTKQLRQAEISLHQIDVEMENYRSLIDLAIEDAQLRNDEVGRLQNLVNDGASSPSEFDRSRSTEIGARNSLETLKNQARVLVTRRAAQQSAIEVAASQLEQAELDLKRTKITAPADGVIVSELVQKSRFVPVGTSLATIEDTSSVEVLCNLRSEHLYQLWETRGASDADGGNRASYELPRVPATVIYEVAGRRFAWEGRLDRYDGLGLDPRTRTVPIRIVVKDPLNGRCLDEAGSSAVPPALVRGMFVTVELNIDAEAQQLAKLPASAIRPGKIIYRLVDGKLKIEKVRIARITNEYAILETAGADFSIGDPVIMSPLPSPEDGMEVEVSNGTQPAGDNTSAEPDDASDANDSGSGEDIEPADLSNELLDESSVDDTSADDVEPLPSTAIELSL